MKLNQAQHLLNRLFDKIEMPDGFGGCWEWTGSVSTTGAHGRIKVARKVRRVHRVMYELVKGPIGDQIVRHTCHNSRCCSPFHLVLGSQKDNVQDMVEAGRHTHKLTDSDVMEIRNRHFHGESVARLSWDFSINDRYVRSIVSRERRTAVL